MLNEITRKPHTIFKYDNVIYVVAHTGFCGACALHGKRLCIIMELTRGKCHNRKDGHSTIFKVIRKIN